MSSSEMRTMVKKAIDIQRKRYMNTSYSNNGSLDDKGIETYCALDKNCNKLLQMAYDKFGFSMRTCSRLVKVARTIADLEDEKNINEEHITEALMYRISDGGQVE